MRITMFHSEIFLRDDGIVQVNTKNHNYTRQNIIDINRAQGKICAGKKRPLLTIAAPYGNIDGDAREYMASPEATMYSSAEAFVITSLGHKILANFYLKVNKPGVPTRFFNDIRLAEEWLKAYLPSDL
jgi:hypothetical protein